MEDDNDANRLLRVLRDAADEWRDADNNYQEAQAGTTLALAFEELDQHLQTGGPLPVDWDVKPEPPAIAALALALVHEGKKIQAIKEVRNALGMSLMEAKDYVESLV